MEFTKHTELVEHVKHDRISELALGRLLHNLKRDDAWMDAVGEGGLTRWSDYLSQPEINITQYRANKLIRIYKYFKELGMVTAVIDCPINALDQIARHNVTDSGAIVDLIMKAEHLSAKDFKEEFHDITTDGNRTYTYLVMKRCNETGIMSKVHEIDSREIKSKFDL